MRVLFLGDIVGRPGRRLVAAVLPLLRARYAPDVVLANGENAAHGKGITRDVARQLVEAGIDAITLGNHTWDNRDVFELFAEGALPVVRPANYPPGTPGPAFWIVERGGFRLAVVNLMGRAFMPPLCDPFRTIDGILRELEGRADAVFVDVHAEATAEKQALAWYLDGRVSAVVGTHTHVPTADARILPGGTAYLTDVGMTGPRDGILGMEREGVLRRTLTYLPGRFEVEERGGVEIGVCAVEIDASGRSVKIESARFTWDSLEEAEAAAELVPSGGSAAEAPARTEREGGE
ncbi:TIGR00282 family metallophosphoesterase [Brockia lithotrophica]|uniref:Phosphoesterase n=1 Tax=Brockia lithotrophica TaxID=933949 RepID=A0A660L4Z2_9BACL|nr:TIGR00282 family metallophosphoesterase [Brockia lithotrophica]RKQ88385.1 hypothetical protein C7438_0018 [Brockia lithotrophica]